MRKKKPENILAEFTGFLESLMMKRFSNIMKDPLVDGRQI